MKSSKKFIAGIKPFEALSGTSFFFEGAPFGLFFFLRFSFPTSSNPLIIQGEKQQNLCQEVCFEREMICKHLENFEG